jgi:thioredoxin reductase
MLSLELSTPGAMAAIKNVVVVGGGPSAKHCSELLVKTNNVKVTQISANKFVEWPLAMPAVLSAVEKHDKALAPNPETFQVKGVTYKYGPVTSVDTAAKTITFKANLQNDEVVQYDALIVATGFGLPLVYPEIGVTLADRKAQVQKVAAAIKKANSIVISGGGVVGVEMVGALRSDYPEKSIKLLTRGKVLSNYPEKSQNKALEVLKSRNIVVITGESSDAPSEFAEGGSLTVGGTKVEFDVFLPMFGRGPNTKFLEGTGVIDDRGAIKVNEFLQSKVAPEIFAVGVGDNKEAFTNFLKLDAQWKSVTGNVKAFLVGKGMKVHKEAMPQMTHPPNFIIGHGKGGYANLDFEQMPCPAKFCCCCGLGGFPFCPPPCCWGCCCHPCCMGYCGGPSDGSGLNAFMAPMAFKSGGFHFKGLGEAPKQQAMQ